MTNAELAELYRRYVVTTYGNYPVAIVRGEGCRVWDVEGKEYLDFFGGIAVNSLGHCHPKVVAAIREQAGRLLHISNWYLIEPQIRLAKLLVENSFADKVFFCNSGAEANEAAIKLARKWGHDTRGGGCHQIICMDLAFHGRTMATISATGQEKLQKGFEPLMQGFKVVPFNDMKGLLRAIGPGACAVIIEPILGESGIILPKEGYLKEVRKVCNDLGMLLIFDEVQMGLGRTGRLFAYQHFDIEPDIMTLAKALGGGFPIGAMLCKDEVAAHFGPGSHGSTFGGNPLACAAANAAFSTIVEDGLVDNSREMGAYLLGRLQGLKEKCPLVKDVRGLGLAVAMELNPRTGVNGAGDSVLASCRELGLLVNLTMQVVLRFLPPLIVTREEVDRAVAIIEKALARETA